MVTTPFNVESSGSAWHQALTASADPPGDSSVIDFGIGPGPQPRAPQPPNSAVTHYLEAMPEASVGSVITHATLQRRALSALTFTVIEDGVARQVVAWPSSNLTRVLPDEQHNRVVELLNAASHAQAVLSDGWDPKHIQLALVVPDPRAEGGDFQASIPIHLDIALGNKGYANVVDSMLVGAGNNVVRLPVQQHRQFASGRNLMDVLMPAAFYNAQQARALNAQAHTVRFTFREPATVQYGFEGEGLDRGTFFKAALELRYQPALAAWLVSAVGVEATRQLPLQLSPDDIEWMATAIPGPRLPKYVTTEINDWLARHQRGVNLPEGVKVRPFTHGFRLTANQLLRDPHDTGEGPQFQRWELTLNLVRHDDRYIAALVHVHQSPHRRSESLFDPYERPSMEGWRNPLARSNAAGSATTESSLFSRITAVSGRSLSPDAYEEGQPAPRRLRGRSPEGPPAQTRAKDQRDSQQFLLELTELGKKLFGAEVTTGAPGVGGGDDVFMSQEAYRATYQLPDDAPVCGAIACSAGLGFHVPFSELLKVNPKADREGTDADQLQALLSGFGGVAVKSKSFMQYTGATSNTVLTELQQHLHQYGHDAAVLLYRVDPEPGDAPGRERSHHVAVFRENGQWMLQDGRINGGQPQPTTLDAVVQGTFGSPVKAFGDLEVLSYVKPPQGWRRTSTNARRPAPASERLGAGQACGSVGVTEIKLSDMQHLPARAKGQPPTGDHALSFDGGEFQRQHSFINCINTHFPESFKTRLHGDKPTSLRIDRHAVFKQVLVACGGSDQTPRQLDPDRSGRPIVEYTDIDFLGTKVNVRMRFSDIDEGKVFDMRIYPSEMEPPMFFWRS